jgi:CHAD domain-containing protein
MKALLEITNSCRAARDADVRQHLVEIWLSRAGLEDHEQGQLLLAMAVQDTEAARHELRRRMNAPKWSHVLWNFRQSAAALVVDDSSDDGFLRDVLSHQRRRLRRGLRKQRNTRKPRRLHRLRLRIKDARYFVEDFGPLAGAAVEGELTKLRELQNALGDFHDEWCLRKWLRKQYKCYLATGAIRELLKVNERKLLKRIRRLGKKAV